jgi:uncharacterized protein
MSRPVHFEICVDNPEEAAKFYKEVFGWHIQEFEGGDGYLLAGTGEGPGIDGGIMKSMDGQQRTVNSINVPDLDAYLTKVIEAGGKQITDKMEIPNVGQFAYVLDNQGCMFGLFQGNQQ